MHTKQYNIVCLSNYVIFFVVLFFLIFQSVVYGGNVECRDVKLGDCMKKIGESFGIVIDYPQSMANINVNVTRNMTNYDSSLVDLLSELGFKNVSIEKKPSWIRIVTLDKLDVKNTEESISHVAATPDEAFAMNAKKKKENLDDEIDLPDGTKMTLRQMINIQASKDIIPYDQNEVILPREGDRPPVLRKDLHEIQKSAADQRSLENQLKVLDDLGVPADQKSTVLEATKKTTKPLDEQILLER